MTGSPSTLADSEATRPALAGASGSGSVLARFIIIQRDGLVAAKKGPLSSDQQVSEYLHELPKHYPSATFTVAEIAYGNDLWLTSACEWLAMDEAIAESISPREPGHPDNATLCSPNTSDQQRPRSQT